MSPARIEVLRLYKSMLIYAKNLTLTDPAYFKRKVAAEFRKNKALTKSEDILFAYQKGEALLRKGAVI